MPTRLEIAVILSTYQRPAHLERSLVSIANQRGVDGKFEVIVTDDGSTDRTRKVVNDFAKTACFPLRWVSHPHEGFRVAFCRNEGVRASAASYILFSDGDCLFPKDHLYKHLLARRPGVVRAGDGFRFDEPTTARIDAAAITSGAFVNWVAWSERKRLLTSRIKGRYYHWLGHEKKPKLTGLNIGISREDFEAVNGFDESFVGWGCEDDDLAHRLRKSGRQIIPVLAYTQCYHMWHPVDPSRPAKWLDGANVHKLDDLERPICCAKGLISTAIGSVALPSRAQWQRARAA
jgi:glycosyltransferase involved in cell wall biosynthesis